MAADKRYADHSYQSPTAATPVMARRRTMQGMATRYADQSYREVANRTSFDTSQPCQGVHSTHGAGISACDRPRHNRTRLESNTPRVHAITRLQPRLAFVLRDRRLRHNRD